jgi:hypothetical protein
MAAGAQEVEATSGEDEGLWDKYTNYWDKILERVIDMDLYGGSAQLPKGIFKFKVDYNMRRAVGRFDNHRVRSDMIPPIEFGEADNPLLGINLGASGEGGGVTMQFSYGITDALDFYFELPFQYMSVQMRPRVEYMHPDARAMINGFLPVGYPQVDPRWFGAGVYQGKDYDDGVTQDRYRNEAAAWFLRFLPRLGRPSMGNPDDYPPDLGPGKSFITDGLVLSDINTGFSWNYYRDKRISAALCARVHFPTGRTADPMNSLMLATGPGLDQGTGSFGVGFTQWYDVRVFQYKHWLDIIIGVEVTMAYYFKSHRRYPDFPKPTQDGNALLDMLDAERNYFPDMSDLTGGTFEYTPGLGVDALLQIGISSLIFDVGLGIGYSYAQEPEFNADWRFETMVRNLEMAAAGHYEVLRFAAGFNLVPFYIPLSIHYQHEWNIGGRNTLIFDRNHWITVEGFLPTVF